MKKITSLLLILTLLASLLIACEDKNSETDRSPDTNQAGILTRSSGDNASEQNNAAPKIPGGVNQRLLEQFGGGNASAPPTGSSQSAGIAAAAESQTICPACNGTKQDPQYYSPHLCETCRGTGYIIPGGWDSVEVPYDCALCLDTKICFNCQGKGCDYCDWTGICDACREYGCDICEDSQICQICYGTGRNPIDNTLTCASCDGSGICQFC
jgi:hypothetical protein